MLMLILLAWLLSLASGQLIINTSGDISGEVSSPAVTTLELQMALSKLRISWDSDHTPLLNITGLIRTPDSYIMATPVEYGTILTYALNGLVNDTIPFTTRRSGLYNVQACLGDICGPSLLVNGVHPVKTWTKDPADSNALFFHSDIVSLPSGDLTFETWAYASSSGYANLHYFSAQSNDYMYSAIFRCYSGQENIYTNEAAHTTTASCLNDQWVHYALVNEGSNVLAYRNGVLLTSFSTTIGRGDTKLIIGKHAGSVLPGDVYDSAHQYLSGDSTTGIRVIDKALTAAEINEIVACGPLDVTLYPDNLVAALSPAEESLTSHFSAAYFTVVL